MNENPVELFDMKVAHVGINALNAEDGSNIADQFTALMGLPKRETPVSYFSDDLVEIMKQNGRGTKGHIGFSVNDCEKAMKFFASRGAKFIEESKKFDENGHCTFVYFDGEIGGFAIHLIEAK